MDVIEPVAWTDDKRGIRILDQRELPGREVYRELRTVDEVYEAILTLAVRGAPAIGIAAAMGMTLAADESERLRDYAVTAMSRACGRIKSARPTAVNLAWAVDRMMSATFRSKLTGQEL